MHGVLLVLALVDNLWLIYEYLIWSLQLQTFPNVPIMWIICQRRIADVKSINAGMKIFVCAWSYYTLLALPAFTLCNQSPACCSLQARGLAWFASHQVLRVRNTRTVRSQKHTLSEVYIVDGAFQEIVSWRDYTEPSSRREMRHWGDI